MYREKDELIKGIEEELQTKQAEMMSLSDQFEQREKEMLDEKGKQNSNKTES